MGYLLSIISILCLLILPFSVLADGSVIGVNYGMIADNLPSPPQVVSLLQSKNINRVRLFDPVHDALNALQNSGIEVILGVSNYDIHKLGGDDDITFAKNWVQTNVVPYEKTIKFRCIAVGNEVLPRRKLTPFVFPAMKNLNAALQSVNLDYIPVSTAVPIYLLATSSPPSTGEFKGEVQQTMQDITGFLSGNGFPLLVTTYPYFAYASNPKIPVSFVVLNSTNVVVRDGDFGYSNMFDAMVDAVYSALEKIGAGSVEVVICKTGWPSDGNGDLTTIDLVQTYNQNLVKHVSSYGTPKRPNKNVETYVFALFNEDRKPVGAEQNFGLFYPNMTEVYHVDFS